MSAYSSFSDQELTTLIKVGDHAAFTEIYDRYKSIVYTFLYKFLKSPELTEDLTQDIFIRLWDKQTDIGAILSIKSYLLTLAKHHTFNFLKRAVIDRNAKAALLQHYQSEPPSFDNTMRSEEYERYFIQELAKLSPQSREVFRLCRQEKNTYEETAALLKISRNTVKKHMVKSMKTLGDAVQRDLGISLSILIAVILER